MLERFFMQAGMKNFFAPQELTFLSDFYVIIEHRFLEERIFGKKKKKKIRHQ